MQVSLLSYPAEVILFEGDGKKPVGEMVLTVEHPMQLDSLPGSDGFAGYGFQSRPTPMKTMELSQERGVWARHVDWALEGFQEGSCKLDGD
jgi:hypothetical protein